FAGFRGGDAFGFEREFHADAAAFDRVAALELGGLDRFRALDFEPLGLLVRADALGGNGPLLGNPRRFDRFTRSDVGLLDRAVARDLERTDTLFLRDARGFGRLACDDAGDVHGLVAFDLQLARGLVGVDALGREGPFACDPGRFDGFLR